MELPNCEAVLRRLQRIFFVLRRDILQYEVIWLRNKPNKRRGYFFVGKEEKFREIPRDKKSSICNTQFLRIVETQFSS